MHEVLRTDALATSHPISIPVQHPDEIAEIFDTISYVKGKHHHEIRIYHLILYLYP